MLQRQIVKVLLIAALFAVMVLLVAKPQNARPGTFDPPTSARVAALIVRQGATSAHCIAPERGVYVCVYDYRGNCVEVELVWAGHGTRFAYAHVVGVRRGQCFKPLASSTGPPA